MIFFLYGPNNFFAIRKINEIIDKYRSKHKSGFNLLKLETTEKNFERLKEAIETTSMFEEKKLIILKDLFVAPKPTQEKIITYFEEKKIFQEEKISIIIFEEKEVDKRKSLFKKLEKKSFKRQEFSELPPQKVKSFIKEEVKKMGGKITDKATEKMIIFFGKDIWQIENEINKLISYKENKEITENDIEILGSSTIDSNIFYTIEAISKKNKKEALRRILEHLEKGENEIKILSMINYQFRNLIKIRSLIDEKKSFFQIQKITKLHPFVVKKAFPIAKGFSILDLKNVYNKLLEIDFAIKTGKIEPRLGIEMFITEI